LTMTIHKQRQVKAQAHICQAAMRGNLCI
jgi:hypothetical protein